MFSTNFKQNICCICIKIFGTFFFTFSYIVNKITKYLRFACYLKTALLRIKISGNNILEMISCPRLQPPVRLHYKQSYKGVIFLGSVNSTNLQVIHSSCENVHTLSFVNKYRKSVLIPLVLDTFSLSNALRAWIGVNGACLWTGLQYCIPTPRPTRDVKVIENTFRAVSQIFDLKIIELTIVSNPYGKV